MSFSGDENCDSDCDGDNRRRKGGPDKKPLRNKEKIEHNHAKKSKKSEFHRDFDKPCSVESKGKNVKNCQKTNTESINLHGAFCGSVLASVEKVKDLRGIQDKKSDQREEKENHKTKCFVDEVFGFLRISFGCGFGNSRDKSKNRALNQYDTRQKRKKK